MRPTGSSLLPVFVLVAMLAPLPASWAESLSPVAASAQLDLAPDRLSLDLGFSHLWAILRMSGPGEWEHTEVFASGEPILFQLVPGSGPADGWVDWELTFLRAGVEDPTREERVRGSFEVSGGAILARPVPDSGGSQSVMVSPGGTLDEHVNGDLTVLQGICAGCLEGTDPDFGTSVNVDTRFALDQAVAFGDGVDPTLLLRWDESASLFFWSTPLAMDDFNFVFGEHKVGLSTGTIPKELNLAGEPLADPALPGFTRRNPEIRFQASSSSIIGGATTRDWDLGASTGNFWVRDETADAFPLVLQAGATGQIVVGAQGVDIDGDLILPEGEMTAQTVRLSSSRSRKENLVPVDPDALLRRLGRVPVYEWSFRGDESGTRHVGPVAEEFHAAFALPGQSVEHLSVTDLAGISLAAIQALERRVAALEAENRRLASGLAETPGRACDRSEKKGLPGDGSE